MSMIQNIKEKPFNTNIGIKLHNRFDIEVIDTQSKKIKKRAKAENVILNNLWITLLGNNDAYFNSIHFGKGTSETGPSPTDTSLFSFVGGKTAGSTYIETNEQNNYAFIRKKIVLSETEFNNTLLTEVGIARGNSNSTGYLSTHAMLKDMNNQQISILKTDTDIINIYATVYVYWTSRSFDNGYIYFTSLASKSNSLLQFFLGNCSGIISYTINRATINRGYYGFSDDTSDSRLTIKNFTSNLTNKTITINMNRASVNSYNILTTGIMSIDIWYHQYNGFQAFYRELVMRVGGSWYPGTIITNEPIGIGDGETKEFKTKFDLVTNATIYVDGVPVGSDVSVLNYPLIYDNLGVYFIYLDESSTPSNHKLGLNGGVRPFNANAIYSDNDNPVQAIFYNPNYDLGIASCTFMITYNDILEIYMSNDLVNWTLVVNAKTGTYDIPIAYQKYKYLKIKFNNGVRLSSCSVRFIAPSNYVGNNIVFNTAPSEGAVIVANYFTKTIAKDTDHVFDLSFTFHLGEYTT